MKRTLVGAIGLCAVAACASHPQPTEHLASAMAAVRGAETAGAAQVPQAALHLKLAEDQVNQAQEMIRNEDNERADAMTIRAYADAELALALTREAHAKREVEQYAEANPDVNQDKLDTSPRLEATDPPGVAAPKTQTTEVDN